MESSSGGVGDFGGFSGGQFVLADIPAFDPSPDLIPAAETLAFPAYVSTALSTLSFGPSFAVASSLAAVARGVISKEF